METTTYNKFPEDDRIVVHCQDCEKKFDLLLFDLEKVVSAHQEPCKEGREQVLNRQRSLADKYH